MSNLIKLKDYSNVSEKNELTQEKLREQLLKLSADNVFSIPEMSDEEKESFRVLANFNGKLWTQNYTGILQIEDRNVFISSRFDDDSCFFTQYILDKALGMKINIFQDMKPGVNHGGILEQLLAFIFVEQIEHACRKGLYRRYRTYECNDSRVKGKIDITRHIRLNPLNNGKIAYSYREYTIDNDVNKLIFTAYTYLQKRYPDTMKSLEKRRKTVGECMSKFRNIMQPASRQEAQKLIQRERRKITHSVYHDWEEVRKTAIILLRHMGISVENDKDKAQNKIHGVLINMNWIWEKYLESILKDKLKEEYCLKAQHEKKIFFLNGEGQGKRTLKPDLCIFKKENVNTNTPVLILDAKYKNAWSKAAVGEEFEESVREDCFQILSYMYGFGCNKSGIFCPVVEAEEEAPKLLDYTITDEPGSRKYEKFYLLPLQIPKSENNNFKNFKNEIKDSEDKFAAQVKDILLLKVKEILENLEQK